MARSPSLPRMMGASNFVSPSVMMALSVTGSSADAKRLGTIGQNAPPREGDGARRSGTPSPGNPGQPALVRLVHREPPLLAQERAVGLGNAWIAAEREQHLERGLGVVARSVSVLEGDAEARGALTERARTLLVVQLARPDERVEPLHVPAERGGECVARDPRARALVEENSPVERPLVRCAHAP